MKKLSILTTGVLACCLLLSGAVSAAGQAGTTTAVETGKSDKANTSGAIQNASQFSKLKIGPATTFTDLKKNPTIKLSAYKGGKIDTNVNGEYTVKVSVIDLKNFVKKTTDVKVKFENGVANASLDTLGTGYLRIIADIQELRLLGKFTFSLS